MQPVDKYLLFPLQIIRAPVRIASASFSLIISLNKEIIGELLQTTRNKNKKHNNIVMLAKSKLNNIEKLISQASVDLEMIQGEWKSIINEEENYRRLKENIGMTKSDGEKDELSENNKNIKGN